jgi:ribonuclease P/MRP protein subunit RPP40
MSESERDLGIQVQPDLKWKEHTQICVNKASRVLGMLKNTFESRDCELWSNLFRTYVRPHLEFAVAAWSPPNMTEIMILEKVQQRATRIPVFGQKLQLKLQRKVK